WYSACARVGHDPKAILAGLRAECDKRSMSNRLLSYGGGGIENCAGFNAIHEMLLQSHEGVLRFFPCWPKDQDARFGTLRAVGAFLVSAEMKNGVVSGVTIISEKGSDCTVVTPWPGKTVKVAGRETLSGDRFSHNPQRRGPEACCNSCARREPDASAGWHHASAAPGHADAGPASERGAATFFVARRQPDADAGRDDAAAVAPDADTCSAAGCANPFRATQPADPDANVRTARARPGNRQA
ncbi:MAG: glycoside hydrolase family 95-like protein, partial [Verrucomicrobiota bacterium]